MMKMRTFSICGALLSVSVACGTSGTPAQVAGLEMSDDVDEPGAALGSEEVAGLDESQEIVGDESAEPSASAGNCQWEAGQAAVSLTYDDAMPTQLSTAIPALDALDLKATFFVTDIRSSTSTWKNVVDSGHELAVHTFNHPCPARNSWVDPTKSNESYDLERMATELDEGIAMLEGVGQLPPYSFAYPCGETYVGEERESYIPLVEERFAAARGVMPQVAGNEPDFMNVPAFFLSGTADAMIQKVEEAQKNGEWVVFGFHGIGGDWEITPAESHQELLDYLSSHQDELYIAPFGEVAQCLKN